MFEPDANFDKQRRLIAYAPSSNPRALCDDPHGSVFSSAPTEVECSDEVQKWEFRTRVSGPSRDFAEKCLQHATTAAEVTRDRNQKAESAEKEGGGHEINIDDFRLTVRPAAHYTGGPGMSANKSRRPGSWS
jgi:hypothetical protein